MHARIPAGENRRTGRHADAVRTERVLEADGALCQGVEMRSTQQFVAGAPEHLGALTVDDHKQQIPPPRCLGRSDGGRCQSREKFTAVYHDSVAAPIIHYSS